MTLLIAYYRVSTQKQGRSGLGLEAQRAAVALFAKAEGFEIIEEFTEIETGKGSDALDRRPKLKAALKAAKHRGVDVASGSTVISVDVSGGRATGVTTDKTSYHGGAVVNCAGAWAGQIGPLELPARPVKGQMVCFAMPRRDVLRHVVRSPEIYLIPRSDGRLLAGATVEDSGFDKRTVPETIQRLRQAAIALLPALEQARLL